VEQMTNGVLSLPGFRRPVSGIVDSVSNTDNGLWMADFLDGYNTNMEIKQ
jgi:hypothetical protein